MLDGLPPLNEGVVQQMRIGNLTGRVGAGAVGCQGRIKK